MGNREELRDLLEERGKTYGDSWKLGGRFIAQLLGHLKFEYNPKGQHPEFIGKYLHPMCMILVKIARLTALPTHVDSWRDIAGYAMMVVEHLEREAKDAPF